MIFVQENLPVPVAVRPLGVREEVQLEPQLVQVLPLQTGDVQPLLQKLWEVIADLLVQNNIVNFAILSGPSLSSIRPIVMV